MEKQRHDGHKEGMDLSQLWLRHLRQNAKPNVVPPCRYCRDRKICPNEELLWAHYLEHHAESVPKDQEEREKFRREVLSSQTPSPMRQKPRDDSAATKPHEELAAVDSESSKLPKGDLDSSRGPPLKTSSLTANELRNLRDNTSDAKHFDPRVSPSVKRRAIGHGRSPSSSVRTTCSNDSSRRIPAKGFSPSRISSPQQQDTSLRKAQDLDAGDPPRPPATGKRLFQPDSDSPYGAPISELNNAGQTPKSSSQKHQHRRGQSGGLSQSHRPVSSGEPGLFSASVLTSSTANETTQQESLKIVRQPETRPISQEQLVAEVKGIYAGLVMVEGKCIQVDAKQAALSREASEGAQPKLNNEQWQALIALHRTLLHEHHDFFLASQHPSATTAVRNLAIKYAMPARLWRHGIHSFLELLRNRLPDSLDHMLAFIYLAYSMMTLLYETVPVFEETWIECLGDLGRYRMAIEDDDIRDREVWTQVARQWYLKASGRSPETGRLYHHLAILARPNVLQQLFFYYKSLSVPQVFVAGKESILTIFHPIMDGTQARRLPLVITTYVKLHAILFTGKSQETFDTTLAELPGHLSSHIGRVTMKYLEQGYYIAISNILTLLGNGIPNAVLAKALFQPVAPTAPPPAAAAAPAAPAAPATPDAPSAPATPNAPDTSDGSMVLDATDTSDASMSGINTEIDDNKIVFERARRLFVQTVQVHLQRVGDPNILSFLHVTMVFMVFVSYSDDAMELLKESFPWAELVLMLNTLLRFYHNYPRIEGDLLPVPDKNDFRPTPEEFALRGLPWTVRYFVSGWFRNKNIEDENQYKEDASMNTDYRPERILWLGCRLAKSGKYIRYQNHKFWVTGNDPTVDTIMEPATPSDLELDSENESTTDTATLMADDADEEGVSFPSRSSSKLTDAQGQASQLGIETPSTWSSQQPQEVNMEVEEVSSTRP